MARLSLLLGLSALLACSGRAHAQTTPYENDFEGWFERVDEDTTLITFDDVEGSLTTPIEGDEFADRPGAPVITLIDGAGIFVGNPSPGQIPSPPSGENMLGPAASGSVEGILRITFDTPVGAVGATFVDVEADFASTGFDTNLGAALPAVSFSGNQGQGTFAFLGFVSETAFTDVEIHFATGSNIDGVLIDDLTYAFGTSTSGEEEPAPDAFRLSPVYPNPHGGRARLHLSVARAQHVRVEVVDVLGRRVALVHDGVLAAREHVFTLDAGALPSGAYQVRVTGEDFAATQRSTLLR